MDDHVMFTKRLHSTLSYHTNTDILLYVVHQVELPAFKLSPPAFFLEHREYGPIWDRLLCACGRNDAVLVHA